MVASNAANTSSASNGFNVALSALANAVRIISYAAFAPPRKCSVSKVRSASLISSNAPATGSLLVSRAGSGFDAVRSGSLTTLSGAPGEGCGPDSLKESSRVRSFPVRRPSTA
jgi:hypothetical protein